MDDGVSGLAPHDRSLRSAGLYGVGLLGAGPVMQAIHLPTLARLADRFRIVHVMDVDPVVGEAVARRVGARCSTVAEDLIGDPEVDVVVVGSPDRFHAEQVIAACRGGKRLVLCEKPLAVTADEARAIADASRSTGVPVLVGTMHAFDPAWLRGLEAWQAGGQSAEMVRISALVPPNPRSEDFATEIVGRPAVRPAPPRTAQETARAVRGGVLGLAMHELPLARMLLPAAPVHVVSALALRPSGYEILAEVGDALLEVQGSGSAPWDPQWEFEAAADQASLSADFSLSYVHAGSAVVRLSTARQSVEYGSYPENGYLREWQHVDDVLSGRAPAPDVGGVVDDLLFALEIADQAASLVAGQEEGERA